MSLIAPLECRQFNDAEWRSLPLQPTFDHFKKYVLEHRDLCGSVISRLFNQMTNDFRLVAENMGALNPDQFSVLEKLLPEPPHSASASVVVNQLWSGPSLVYALNGWHESFTRSEALGLLAHETSHQIYKHTEIRWAIWLQMKGIAVKSLEDVAEFVLALATQSALPPKGERANRLFWEFMKLATNGQEGVMGTQEQIAKIRFEISREASEKGLDLALMDMEWDADSLTMRVPEYARGLRDGLSRWIGICNEKAPNPSYCDGHYRSTFRHPSTMDRIRALTSALCTEYPEKNRDICSEAYFPKLSNHTCAMLPIPKIPTPSEPILY